jgi:hypothetical protein
MLDELDEDQDWNEYVQSIRMTSSNDMGSNELGL